MPTCDKCGFNIGEKDNFCKSCGTSRHKKPAQDLPVVIPKKFTILSESGFWLAVIGLILFIAGLLIDQIAMSWAKVPAPSLKILGIILILIGFVVLYQSFRRQLEEYMLLNIKKK